MHCLFRALLLAALCLGCTRARAELAELPEELVVRFDDPTRALDQEQIRQALQRELGIPLASAGSAGAPTLLVRLDEDGDLELTYDPERRRLTRSAPITESTNLPELVAHLAGNMVRDEASMLISDLRPTAQPGTQPAGPVAVGATATPPARAPATPPPSGLWAITLLLGGGIRPMANGVFTLQVSRRFSRLELGLALEYAAGRGSAALGDPGEHPGFYGYTREAERIDVMAMLFTVPLSLDLDLLRREQGALQLGVAGGYRLAGVVYQQHLSGSDGDLFMGVRFTASLKLRERRSVVLRGTWDVLPAGIAISVSEGTLNLLSFGGSIQLGYALAF